MKWIALPIVLVGAALSIVAVLLPGSDATSSVLAGYEALRKAETGLPGTVKSLEQLADREDAVGWEACIAAARAHESESDFSGAAEFLRQALDLRPTSDLRAELASALEAAGERTDAKTEWEKLLPRADAVSAMVRLEPDASRLAGVLIQAGRYADALPFVTPPTSDTMHLLRARALAGLGKSHDAAAEFALYLSTHKTETSVRLEYGRALERAGESDQALAVYQDIGVSAAYREGQLLENLGRVRDAIAAYQQSADSEARWRAARLLESLGDTQSALSIYEALAAGTHRVHDDAALRAVLLLKSAGKTDEATTFSNGLPDAFDWILGNYVPRTFSTSSTDAVSGDVTTAIRVANALSQKGNNDWAEAELEFALVDADAAGHLAIGQWFASHGDPRRAFQIGTELLAKNPTRATYELAYPKAYWTSVEHWASTYALDPYLVLAVVREESNYLPTAVSSSNALGLMQLLPSTAKWIAESKCKLAYTSDLAFDPDANIRMGAWYLSYLASLYEGDIVRAVAAYNGGNGNVDRWTATAKATRRADVPGSLVSIETREYLTKVLDSWLMYRALYAPNPTS